MKHAAGCECHRCSEPKIVQVYNTKVCSIRATHLELSNGTWWVHYTLIPNDKQYAPSKNKMSVQLWNKYAARWEPGKGSE